MFNNSSLPTEIFYHVIPHLDDASLQKARQTTTRFRKFVDTNVPVLLVTLHSDPDLTHVHKQIQTWQGTRRAVVVFSNTKVMGSSAVSADLQELFGIHIVDIYQATTQVQPGLTTILRKNITYTPNIRGFYGFGPEPDLMWQHRQVGVGVEKPVAGQWFRSGVFIRKSNLSLVIRYPQSHT